tara:strand:- start:957 stop:1187 length:231 start_codon:yes stop_codon:yes gene_type:complete
MKIQKNESIRVVFEIKGRIVPVECVFTGQFYTYQNTDVYLFINPNSETKKPYGFTKLELKAFQEANDVKECDSITI